MGCTKLEKFYVCLGPLAALDPVVIVRLWVKPLPSVRARHVEECARALNRCPTFWLVGSAAAPLFVVEATIKKLEGKRPKEHGVGARHVFGL